MKKPRVIIIRGPPGVGKSTVAKALRDNIKTAVCFDVDALCESFGEHPKKQSARFLAHEIIQYISRKFYTSGYDIIIERFFLEQADIDNINNLFSKTQYAFFTFTLCASLNSLINNDSKRSGKQNLGQDVIKLLYSRFINSNVKNPGIIIQTDNKSVDMIVEEIGVHLNK